MKPIRAKHYVVTNYWYQFYVKDGFCSLCGNHGVIDTRNVRTPVGHTVGRLNYCICPNGQAMRKGNPHSLPVESRK